jgi:hypothetical protein
LSKKEKLVARLISRPKDFTFEELTSLLGCFGYKQESSGRTSGSRVVFSNGRDYIRLHKPHPRNILKSYQVDDIITALRERGLV